MKKVYKIYKEVTIEYAYQYESGYGSNSISTDKTKTFVEVWGTEYKTIEDAKKGILEIIKSNYFDDDTQYTILPIYERSTEV